MVKYRLPADTPVDRLHGLLKARFAVASAGDDPTVVIERYEAENRRIMAFISERRLFPVPVLMLRTPGFMVPSIPAGAMLVSLLPDDRTSTRDDRLDRGVSVVTFLRLGNPVAANLTSANPVEVIIGA